MVLCHLTRGVRRPCLPINHQTFVPWLLTPIHTHCAANPCDFRNAPVTILGCSGVVEPSAEKKQSPSLGVLV